MSPNPSLARRHALALARELLEAWSPDELPLLDIVEERFLFGLEEPEKAIGRQELGIDFFVEAGCAAMLLYGLARELGVGGLSGRFRISFDAEILCDLAMRRAPRGLPPRDGVLERALASALAACWSTVPRAKMACSEAGVPEADIGHAGGTLELWAAVIGKLSDRRDFARLEELVTAALEEQPSDRRLQGWQIILRSVR